MAKYKVFVRVRKEGNFFSNDFDEDFFVVDTDMNSSALVNGVGLFLYNLKKSTPVVGGEVEFPSFGSREWRKEYLRDVWRWLRE